ncbi:MAG: bifunctional DNA-formamidopyrimidine glycosylase/DNA-(apurinic or apyrimidinic site) lyase [Terriglobia bacterium]
MPELPEVETVRRGLDRHLPGRILSAVEILCPAVIRGNPEDFRRGVEGQRVARLTRKGKALVIEFSPPDSSPPGCLVVRLGMTGQVLLSRRDSPLLPHTHVRVILDGGPDELRYRDARRFGSLRYCTKLEAERILNSLGPDALEATPREFERALEGRRGAIKSWLMNQRMLAGLGNIYADEALFAAHIHPETPAGAIGADARRRLYRAIRNVLRRAVERQGTSFRDYTDIEGNPGNFEPLLRAYGRTGQPCRRCATPIRRRIVSGRSSHFCPRCQRRRVRSLRSPSAATAAAAARSLRERF